MSARALLVDVWLIAECPHCHAPQIIRKSALPDGRVINVFGGHTYTCHSCDKIYYLEVTEYEPVAMENMK